MSLRPLTREELLEVLRQLYGTSTDCYEVLCDEAKSDAEKLELLRRHVAGVGGICREAIRGRPRSRSRSPPRTPPTLGQPRTPP